MRLTKDPETVLTERQTQLLAAAANGMTRKEIGRSFFLSEWTVKMYLDEARGALKARNLTHSVALAIAVGALYVDDDGVVQTDCALPTAA